MLSLSVKIVGIVLLTENGEATMKVLVTGDDVNLKEALARFCEVVSLECGSLIRNDNYTLNNTDTLHGKRKGKRSYGRNNDLDLARRYGRM